MEYKERGILFLAYVVPILLDTRLLASNIFYLEN